MELISDAFLEIRRGGYCVISGGGGLKEFPKITYTILQVKCSFFMFLRILSNAAQFESCCKT
jgi:hypothetical protein